MKKKLKLLIILLLLLLGILTTLNPIFPKDQLLQHIGTVLLLGVLVVDLIRNRSWIGFIGVSLFAALHIIGARYVYSNVPYYDWFPSIFTETERNHFDRFVHFSFGILFFPYIFQFISKWHLPSYIKTLFITWLLIQSMSLGYELFEWGLTLMTSAENAETYNGQQGDMWDAQKDMALAMLGSSIVVIYYLSIYKFSKK